MRTIYQQRNNNIHFITTWHRIHDKRLKKKITSDVLLVIHYTVSITLSTISGVERSYNVGNWNLNYLWYHNRFSKGPFFVKNLPNLAFYNMCISETSMWPVTIRQGNWWYWAITSWSRNVSGTVYYHAIVSLFHKKMWEKSKWKVVQMKSVIFWIFSIFWGRSKVGEVCLKQNIFAVQRPFKGGSLLVNYKKCPIVLN